jgi:hypothetical protein
MYGVYVVVAGGGEAVVAGGGDAVDSDVGEAVGGGEVTDPDGDGGPEGPEGA